MSPLAPWVEGGVYWGYKVRLAPSLAAVFTESPFTVSQRWVWPITLLVCVCVHM